MTVVPVYSDIHCPWATLAVTRLRRARDEHGLDVVFDPRAWPLEWVNEQATPRHIVEPETALLAHEEPEVYAKYRGDTWPSTFLPAFELVAAARRALGVRAAEDVDMALRLGFFRDSRDVALRHELRASIEEAGVDVDAVMDAWHDEPVRADVAADYAASFDVEVQGSPQIVWPDGTTTHNPGVEGMRWSRGLPFVDRIDPLAPERLLTEKVAG